MVKRFSLLCSLFLMVAAGYSIPARKVSKTVVQKDGTELTLWLQGDEFLRYYTTEDGVPVKESGDGVFYAQLDGDTLRCTGWLAHEGLQRTEKETLFADSIRNAFLDKQLNIREERKNSGLIKQAPTRSLVASAAQGRSFGTQSLPEPLEGQKKGLVILVEFPDQKMSIENPQTVFNDFMNQIGYKGHGQYGSVRDYFLSQSYGKFDFQFDVVGPVQVSKNMSYYGSNYKGFDMRPGEMIYEACKLADSQVNFKDYDWNGDGEAEQIFVIYAGYAESNGAPANTIWPHQSYVQTPQGGDLILDGVVVGKYACSSELKGTRGTTISGIGTLCHEFSHCFGIPDFYDTAGMEWGMSVWSLMDYGCYNGDGNVPISYTAYERMMCGWLDPIILTDARNIESMPPLTQEPVAYAIMNDGASNEYYLLHNSQKDGWNSQNYGKGLMVMHIDYSDRAWNMNTVNVDRNHPRGTLIVADNEKETTYSSLQGDLFPGSKNVKELTDTSVPAAKVYNRNQNGKYLMNKPIYDIEEAADGTISFGFMQKRLDSTGINNIQEPSESDYEKKIMVYTVSGFKIGLLPDEAALKKLPSGLYLYHKIQEKEMKKILIP